jgi:acetyl-CoA carboxylase biotin carboxylase subunit
MKKIKKVLIANRSEIACRIIKSCKELDIRTVAVYSEADKNALHVKLADESVLIGAAPARESYLDMDKLIKAAIDTNCDAIHPGYGFLSENHFFNEKVRDAGLIFIGPNPEAMNLLGSKTRSRETMIKHGIPVVPGMNGSSLDIKDFEDAAARIGFPVLIKASAGGGGKGMRVIREQKDLIPGVESAMRESLSAFGSDEVFIEKFIENPRHIEFQVAADQHGNCIHIFERECSLQRRHQKIIEETPSTALTPELRKKMGQTAVQACNAAGYDNIGTVEFLLDKDGNFYFLEVNARIQVEHPVTEETTGIDLVKLQISLSEGYELPYSQTDIIQQGHAIECRIYAEDGNNNFMPSSGKILLLKEPTGKGIRYDSGIYEGVEISVYYDPIMAKLIVKGENREEARKKMIKALKNNVILGVNTSIEFMVNILESEDFISGNTFTDLIDKNYNRFIKVKDDNLNTALIAASALHSGNKKVVVNKTSDSNTISDVWHSIGNWEICSNIRF